MMRNKKNLLFFILFLVCSRAFPAVFVVTSNADSGPGTFRDALTQAAANGNAVKDYIDFNIADVSEAGRTITVLSQLPDITSNLVIDGSTQPGLVFGVSSAKIQLLFNSTGQAKFSALNMAKQSNVEIYGLYLRLTNSFNQFLSKPIGLHVTATDNLQIGDVQKGNVFAGFFSPVAENDDNISQSNGIIIKSNFFSIQADGLTVTDDYSPGIGNVYGTIIIGGTPAEGNLFAKGIQIDRSVNTKDFTVLFQNNKSGVNYNLTATFASASVTIIDGTTLVQSAANSVVNIEDNLMTCSGAGIAFELGELGGTATVVRNYIGVDKNQHQLGSVIFGIYVQVCKEVHIGDDNTSDANYVGYCGPIFAENTGMLTFNKNSFFCSTHNMVYFDQQGEVRTQCDINSITSNSVTGTSTPNAAVDLYYSDMCNSCAPQYYFTTVTADANGNWAYSGALTGNVIGIATANNSSSEFTNPYIDPGNIKITSACGGTGSITGIVVHSATSIKWLDASRNVVGTTANLLNVKAGKYKLLITNGGCGDSTDYYSILPKFQLDSTALVITQPACGDSAGSVTGLNIINSDNGKINFAWTDSNGKLWGDSLLLKKVPAGTYSLVATGVDTCVQTYGPVTFQDSTSILSPPVANNIELCIAGDAYLRVQNPVAGNSYRLYDTETSTSPIDEQPTGVFKIAVSTSRSYYVSQAFYSCESTRTQVQVGVGITKTIANAFSPNSDGINDYWKIDGIENYPAAQVTVFSRYGVKVFESKGYAKPFDGTLNGAKLPNGTYYYIITLSTACKLFSGSLTIIR